MEESDKVRRSRICSLKALMMENRISNLPPEIESLYKIIAGLEASNNQWSSKYSALSKENSELLDQINKLEEQLRLLKAKRFGKSSEKLEHKIDIVERLLEEEESLLGFQSKSSSFTVEATDKKSQAKRKKLPAHLPREEIVLTPEAKCDLCGGEKFRLIEEDRSEFLEYVPATFKVIRYIRPR